jgi:Protein of unknown function (DUF3800)
MVEVLHLYMDDSGTRHPDRNPGRRAQHGYDWFGLGGVLIRQEDEDAARHLHRNFCERWKIEAPLRSADIRAKSEKFHWLKHLSAAELERFLEDLYVTMAGAPVIGIGCTIDRPGYNQRYREIYGRQRWLLCKTAFSVTVERSAKYARGIGYRLKVFVERGDKDTDRQIEGYYDELRARGMPFSHDTSGKYAPLSAAQLSETLYEFRTKQKTSPLVQLSDLYLWPMCMGGYDKGNRPYARLMNDRKLIDSILDDADVPHLGFKYSCFDLVTPKPQKH